MPILDLRLVAMGHNTVRGAAGGSVLNAELLGRNGALDSRVIVVKFGGTSVGDAEAIERTAAIVEGPARPAAAVVVSALGGATNALLAIGEQAAKGHLIGALRGVERLRDRHLQQCESCSATSDDGAEMCGRAERDVRRARAASPKRCRRSATSRRAASTRSPRSASSCRRISSPRSSSCAAFPPSTSTRAT